MINLKEFGLIPIQSESISIGKQFGRLTVLATGRPPTNYRYQAVCQCECGKIVSTRTDSLTSGRTTSCGCLWLERHTTHGLTKHPLYNVWKNVIDRCKNPKSKFFCNYGGRGISVCDRWQNVEHFIADLEPLHRKGLELDRIDNNGNYEPSNCRFVTRAENADNRRTGRMITFNNKTQSLLKWSKELGINYGTLWTRLFMEGWSVERAFSTPTFTEKERMLKARTVRWGKPS